LREGKGKIGNRAPGGPKRGGEIKKGVKNKIFFAPLFSENFIVKIFGFFVFFLTKSKGKVRKAAKKTGKEREGCPGPPKLFPQRKSLGKKNKITKK